MPNALIQLPDVYETVRRRVAADVISQIGRYMMLPDNVAVYMPGNSETVPMGTLGTCCDTPVRYDPQSKVIVRYDESADEMFTLTTPVYTNQNLPVFEDVQRDIVFRPVRRFVDTVITVEFQSEGIVHAQRWLDDQRTLISRGGAELTLNVEYHYGVPVPCTLLLKSIYDTIQCSEFPLEITYDEWLKQNWRWPTTDVATLVDTHRTNVICERQWQVQGWFDFTTTPDTPRRTDDGSGAYTVTLSFFFRYERPTHLYCRYPMVVHQRPIPRTFRPKQPYETFRQVDRYVSYLRGAMDYNFILMRDNVIPYIQYPDTDDWTTNNYLSNELIFFNGLLSLKKANPRKLMDLKNLGKYSFSPFFLELFATIGNKAHGRQSIFTFKLYRNNEHWDIPLTIDKDDLCLYSTVDLPKENYYHLQIGMQRNMKFIDDSVFKCLVRYPTVLWNYFQFINVSFARGRDIKDIKLLGASVPRPASIECPGEGSTDWTKDHNPIRNGVLGWDWITKGREETGDEWGTRTKPKLSFGPITVLFSSIITERKE